MAKALRALDYLAEPQKHPPQPVCVLFGDEPFLKRQALAQLRHTVLAGDDGEFSLSVLEGPTAAVPDVLQELATVAMFGGMRMVVVEESDPFITRYRPELEDYVARPAPGGVLVLLVKTFPGNTRLYKAVAATGLAIDCHAPPAAGLTKWLAAWARNSHKVQLPPAAAEGLIEIIGVELGLLDQELAKLALVAGADQKITAQMVRQMAGGWRVKTTWEMLDATLSGDAAAAIRQLDRLLASGQTPVGLLGQISASLRRLAAATRLVLQAEAAGRRIAPRNALQQAGVPPFVLQKTERQLRRLGRRRAAQLYRRLLEADLGLKGASALPPRMILERLILHLATSDRSKLPAGDNR